MENREMELKQQKLQQSVLKNFIKDGKLIHLPAQLKKKLIVLEYLASQLEANKQFSEQDINEWIKTYHGDYATIRRELYIHRFVNRHLERYNLNDEADWRDWRTLG